MAKIIITFNEVRASANLVSTILDCAVENDSKFNAEERCKFVRKSAELRDMSDADVRAFFLDSMNDAERKLVNVGYSDLTIEVPEKLVTGYLAKSERFVIKAAPILAAMANLAKSFAMVVKTFEKDIVKLVKETFGSSDKE